METLHADIGRSPHVQSREQAIAIALNTQREAKKKGRKSGGRTHFQYGGFTNPAAAPVSGPGTGGLGMAAPSSSMPTAVAAFSPPPVSAAPPTAYSPPPAMPAPQMAPMAGMQPGNGMGLGTLAMPSPYARGFGAGMGGMSATMPGGMYGPQPTKYGGVARGYALGGPPMPWFSKNEARGLSHTGAIPSIVPGRTDRHNMKVPSGSYVLPADHVSSLGQGNTQAGYAILNHMFHGGPFGGAAPKMGHGMGLPKPPKLQNVMTSSGGARGDHVGTPVDVVTAGGEYVVPPHVVAQIGGGNLDHGHRVLDAWVKKNRNKHIKTLTKLPGPAKS